MCALAWPGLYDLWGRSRRVSRRETDRDDPYVCQHEQRDHDHDDCQSKPIPAKCLHSTVKRSNAARSTILRSPVGRHHRALLLILLRGVTHHLGQRPCALYPREAVFPSPAARSRVMSKLTRRCSIASAGGSGAVAFEVSTRATEALTAGLPALGGGATKCHNVVRNRLNPPPVKSAGLWARSPRPRRPIPSQAQPASPSGVAGRQTTHPSLS